ncbi:MAG: stage IV sporulation protein A [Ruminococcaceae bacterium]|nr:stage IV sporulation protein A [Oscillospiraceae bacterium]
MTGGEIYRDIAVRTGGSLLLGVVGPVRTGKSTFIKKFMNALVIPNIPDENKRLRALDELPQSGAGKTVMTAEPKFVPEEAVRVTLGDAELDVRLIDCVGYLVPGALGQFENDMPRMVSTPWFDEPIPMSEAAELGTKKVINDHSTVGIVVTTDGTITGISREEYAEAEERILEELSKTQKPYVVIVNSVQPDAEPVLAIARDISARYGVTAIPADVMNLDEEKITQILTSVLYEFPLASVDIYLPEWTDSLPADHWVKNRVFSMISSRSPELKKVRDAEPAFENCGDDLVERVSVTSIELGCGRVTMSFELARSVFWQIIAQESGLEIGGEAELLPKLCELARIRQKWERVSDALSCAEQTGYGIVLPSAGELTLEAPTPLRQGNRFGVCLKASAPSIHMIRADIATTVTPIVGSEQQSEELIGCLLREFEGEESKIWESNIFGKSLYELVSEGLSAKINHLPQGARAKLRETLERVINEGSNGLICIIL